MMIRLKRSDAGSTGAPSSPAGIGLVGPVSAVSEATEVLAPQPIIVLVMFRYSRQKFAFRAVHHLCKMLELSWLALMHVRERCGPVFLYNRARI